MHEVQPAVLVAYCLAYYSCWNTQQQRRDERAVVHGRVHIMNGYLSGGILALQRKRFAGIRHVFETFQRLDELLVVMKQVAEGDAHIQPVPEAVFGSVRHEETNQTAHVLLPRCCTAPFVTHSGQNLPRIAVCFIASLIFW
jgi:hypothetical protein